MEWKLAFESPEKLELSRNTLMSELSAKSAWLSLSRTPLRVAISSIVSSASAVPSIEAAKSLRSASTSLSIVISPDVSS